MTKKNHKNFRQHELIVGFFSCFQKTLDILNQNSESPLSVSAAHGHNNIVQWLIMKKVSLNHCTLENCTPLFLAAMNGHDGVVKLLLKSKADPSICRSADNASPVWIASCNGHLDVVKTFAKFLSKQKLK